MGGEDDRGQAEREALHTYGIWNLNSSPNCEVTERRQDTDEKACSAARLPVPVQEQYQSEGLAWPA